MSPQPIRILQALLRPLLFVPALLALAGEPPADGLVAHDLTPLHDPTRVLINPHKGWYHHFPDNHPDKYRPARDAELIEFPGMDHLYIRLAWSYLEPREGEYEWEVIDRIIRKWTAHGLGIAFRISCRETSTDRIEQQFATPRWVMEAGAKGGYYRMGREVGPDGPWEPVFDDPVFLEKLDRFLAAFAARYDSQPWLRYVDIGSIGDWGEGHTWAGSRTECGFAARKQHVDLHLKHFRRAQLVVSDDFVHALNNPAERQALHEYVLSRRISYRDDSILVDGYLEGTSDRFTVRSPEFFAGAYPETPTVLELEHYGAVKRLGNWEGRPNSAVARFGGGKRGPDYFRGALELLHATYIGYHGDAREWLADNPELTRELLNRCGYWLFPTTIELPRTLGAGTTAPLVLTLQNRGVAPPYAPYELRLRLSGADGPVVHTLSTQCRSWLPGNAIRITGGLPLPAGLRPGDYRLAIGLFDRGAVRERPVELALTGSRRDRDGYYDLLNLRVTATTLALPGTVEAPTAPAASGALDVGDSPPVAFASREILLAQAFNPAGRSPPVSRFSFQIDPALGREGFRIDTETGGAVRVVGGDETGAMYGGLELAEAIRLNRFAGLTNLIRRPYVERRGLKFNIPLDLRTPSYSDNSDAAQANIPEMWSRDFWREFLDEMARHRFNVLSLWSLNPFPSIVKVPEYPDVALNDVLRGRRELFDDSFSHSGTGMFKPGFLDGAEVVKRMTIDDKIAFWREVLQMAVDRGVEVYWFTWNAFLFTEEGKHGLRRAEPDGEMLRYFRASVRETVRTYPLLAGMGITAGEYMGQKMGGLTKEQWLWQAYGEGIRDALKETPDRSFRLIHRFHMTGADEILDEWRAYPGPFDFSYKYAVAHMYASTAPRFIEPLLRQFPAGHRTWLTVRNDDIYSFRWGDPAFARAFVKAMPREILAGFYMGPDGYCWGREAMALDSAIPRQLVLRKQWFSFMLWGRLSYDPDLPDTLFERTLALRFPGVPARELLDTWSAASGVIPETTRFFWGNIDLKWLPEACLSHPRHRGFYTVRHFVEGECMPGEPNRNIREWREATLKRAPLEGVSPPEVAANLRRYAERALGGAARLREGLPQDSANDELQRTLLDIESCAHLGRYYADKIEAACSLGLYDATKDEAQQKAAVRQLESALENWNRYASNYTRQYRQPLLYNRVGWVDLPGLAARVAADINIARNWVPGSVGPATTRNRGAALYGE